MGLVWIPDQVQTKELIVSLHTFLWRLQIVSYMVDCLEPRSANGSASFPRAAQS
jgi:hypothetical protein